MAFFMALVLATLVCIQAREFNSPILFDKSYFGPGAIKVNGTYYVVATTTNITDGIFPIHTSTDLKEWTLDGYVFNVSNTPQWAGSSLLESPEIHQIGSKFVLYFTAHEISLPYCIGVATASHPLGPYTSTDGPILAQPRYHIYFPTIINDQGHLYLLWSNSTRVINARQLSDDGLTFSSDQTTTLVNRTLPWEEGTVYSPWYIQRGGFHYLLYNGYCSIGVARSSHALGPYEKLSDPIIVPNASPTSCPSDVSVVKDLDNESDVIIFNDEVNGIWSVLLATLGWGSDDWPYVEEKFHSFIHLSNK